MFNPDLKKHLKSCNSRYSLVVGVARRARDIRDEAIENEVVLDDKCVSLAINDVYDGKFIVEEPEEIHPRDEESASEQAPAEEAPASGEDNAAEDAAADEAEAQ